MFYKRILVALDGSRFSECVLPFVHVFAKALEIPVELLQVIDPEDFRLLREPSHGQYYETEAERRSSSFAYLNKVATAFSNVAKVSSSVQIGKPAAVIIDRATAGSGSLIAMTTHGRSGVQRWLLGSVADKVLHEAASPLLLVRSVETEDFSEARPMKTIWVPLDGSPLAEKVIPHVVEMADKTGLEVVLLRVYLMPGVAYLTGDSQPDWERVQEETRSAADDYLNQKLRELQKQGLKKVSAIVLEGSAAEKIIQTAKEKPDSLIAICTHGRTGIKRAMLGSVADRVVRHGEVPVLLVPSSVAP